ncbi:NADPH-dependent F420 reductase [Methanofollis formosanus]|uniref:NADPH-dependent F420 reductase n=1 Tax=Methanofollis formosanus TaxID=299308 RepID=A0A8G1A335_9EURY|nr:NADPH-dependent F420 reductase [Methanofollis formosanus]QYZ79509.1 NADPH-dependent F420 reductase [Methanofollis formosanus]
MKVGIIGGTGGIGQGMALRLSQNHTVYIGSRKEEKAQAACEMCGYALKVLGLPFDLNPTTNQGVVDNSEIVVFSIPAENLERTIDSLTGLEGKIIVSLMNPMIRTDYFKYNPPEEGSAAIQLQKLLPDSKIVAAFNNIPAGKWQKLSEPLDYSVCVCSDHEDAKEKTMELVNSISELEAVNAGPLAVSPYIEAITPLVINIARFSKKRDVGVYFK